MDKTTRDGRRRVHYAKTSYVYICRKLQIVYNKITATRRKEIIDEISHVIDISMYEDLDMTSA